MNKILGSNIKKFRQEKGISRESLSSILGISIHTLAKYEQGQREPNIETLNKIAKALNIEVDALIRNQEFNIGDKIRKARMDAKISQRELAKKINKTGQFISLIENGKNNPSYDTLFKIAEALETTPDKLLGLSTNCIDLSKISTSKLIKELNSRQDFPIKISIKVGE